MVLAVGALQLIDRVVHFFNKRFMSGSKASSVNATRDDWYMFFNRSDLTGKPKTKPVKPNRKNSAPKSRIVEKRRPSRMRAAL